MNKTITSTTVLDNEFGTVWYHIEPKIIHHRFHKFAFGETFRQILNTGLAAMRENHATKWLSDDREYSAVIPEDVEWAEKVWFSKMLDTGWKYWAILMPEKGVGRMNLRKVIHLYNEQGVIVQIFSNYEATIAWLEIQK